MQPKFKRFNAKRRLRTAAWLFFAALRGQTVDGEWMDADGVTRWTGVIHR